MQQRSGFSRPLGEQIPDTRHAISVSLPAWDDFVAFTDKEPRVMDALKGGYPRFVLHRDVVAVSNLCLEMLHKQGPRPHAGTEEAARGVGCLVFPSGTYASDCREYIARSAGARASEVSVRRFDADLRRAVDVSSDSDRGSRPETRGLYAVFYPEDCDEFARRFWRISGTGISSRLAEDVLIGVETYTTEQQTFAKDPTCSSSHLILQRRIASLLYRGDPLSSAPLEDQPPVSDTVHLYPTGMAAIYSLTKMLRPWSGTKAVVFGFPYDSTLRVHELFAKDHIFFGHGTADELDQLEAHLQEEKEVHSRTI